MQQGDITKGRGRPLSFKMLASANRLLAESVLFSISLSIGCTLILFISSHMQAKCTLVIRN